MGLSNTDTKRKVRGFVAQQAGMFGFDLETFSLLQKKDKHQHTHTRGVKEQEERS